VTPAPTHRDLATSARPSPRSAGSAGAKTARSPIFAVLAALALAVVLGGCGGGDDRQGGTVGATAPAAAPVPFRGCAELTAAPTIRSGAVVGAAPANARALPSVTLDCMADGTRVATAQIKGPAVVNLWASWCAPCRSELPAFQRLGEAAAGRIHVVGVDTRDDRAAAIDLADQLGLTFPSLADPEQKVLAGLARPGLPVTAFVDAGGKVRHLYNGKALDEASLTALVRQHLGVAVPVG
jgi:thiol-disulfide isomerase/thioredoxin